MSMSHVEMFVRITLISSYFLTNQQILAMNHQHLDDCIRKTGVHITPEMLKNIHDANKGGTFNMNSIPAEMLCLPKCVLEKRNIINSKGKISIDNIKDDPITQRIPNKKKFLECLQKIEKIGSCEDMKKMLQCRIISQ